MINIHMVFDFLVATEACNEGDGFAKFCVGSERSEFNELCYRVLSEEVEKPGKLPSEY